MERIHSAKLLMATHSQNASGAPALTCAPSGPTDAAARYAKYQLPSSASTINRLHDGRSAAQAAATNPGLLARIVDDAHTSDHHALKQVSSHFYHAFQTPEAWAKRYGPAHINWHTQTVASEVQLAWRHKATSRQTQALRVLCRDKVWTIASTAGLSLPCDHRALQLIDTAIRLDILKTSCIFIYVAVESHDGPLQHHAQRTRAYRALLTRGYLRHHGRGPLDVLPKTAAAASILAVALCIALRRLEPFFVELTHGSGHWLTRSYAAAAARAVPSYARTCAFLASFFLLRVVVSPLRFVALNRMADEMYSRTALTSELKKPPHA